MNVFFRRLWTNWNINEYVRKLLYQVASFQTADCNVTHVTAVPGPSVLFQYNSFLLTISSSVSFPICKFAVSHLRSFL